MARSQEEIHQQMRRGGSVNEIQSSQIEHIWDRVNDLDSYNNDRIQNVKSLQNNIDEANEIRATTDNTIQSNIDILAEIVEKQNNLIEKLAIQLEADKNRISELEKAMKLLNEFKDQVCDSGGVDCSNPDLEPEPCIMGSCESSNY
jgi:predicted RNase H-like nuclease (RuvC/YqgF family)